MCMSMWKKKTLEGKWKKWNNERKKEENENEENENRKQWRQNPEIETLLWKVKNEESYWQLQREMKGGNDNEEKMK